MPQSYSPVYLPQDWSATSMGANNISADVPVDSTTRELTIPACLDPSTLTNTSAVISNNNRTFRSHSASAWHGLRANIGINGTDKVYWEVVCSEDDDDTFVAGVGSKAAVLSNSPNTAGSLSYIQPGTDSGEKYDGTAISVTMGNAVGDVWGFAVDYANQDLYVSKNGIWWNGSNFTSSPTAPGTIWDATLSNSVTLFPIIQGHNQGETTTMRFSSDDWYYSAPSTYTALTKTVTGVGNHWTLNPLASTDTLTNGNLAFTGASNFSSYVTAPALPLTGKWYWEIRAVGSAAISASANYDTYVGVVSTDVAIPTASHTGNANLWVWANQNPGESPGGQKHNNSTATLSATTGFGDNSIIMIAVDMDNSKIYFGNDGTWAGSGNPASGSNPAFSNLSGQVMPFQSLYDDSATYNFGAKPFIHTPPTGFKALSTANLPAPTVKNPDDGFALITLQNGATIEASLATARTGWSSFIDVFKREDTNNEDYDVRFSDDSGNSMHFNTNAAAGSELSLASGVNYSAWSWRVGATYGCYTAEISHTNGATTNQAHGLGSGAKTAVAKRSDSTGDWYVSHPNLSSANIRFNVQEATTTELVTVDGTNVTLNSSFATGTYRVIVWEQIEGFSAFTGYIHNGSTTDGPYINLGGSASLIAWRNIDSSNSNDFFSTFPSYTSTGGNPTDIRYNWGNGEKGYSGITIGDVIANGYKMRPSSGSAFGKDADDPMLVWAWGLRPFGGSGVAQARTRS